MKGLAGTHVFRVQLRMRPRAGAEERFDAALAGVGRVVAGNPDNVDQWILRSDEDGGVVYVFSDWVSEEAFRKHERSEAHRLALAELREHRTDATMTTSRVLHHVSAPAQQPRPVRVLVWYWAPESECDRIEQFHRQIVAALRGTPGLRRAELHRSLSDEGGFLVVSEWSDVDAFHAWERGPRHRAQTSPLRPYLDRGRAKSAELYEVIPASLSADPQATEY